MANEEMLEYAEKQNRQRSISLKQLNEMQEEAQQQISKQQAMIHAQEQELNLNRKRIFEEQKLRELEYAKMQEEAQQQISKQQQMIHDQEQELNMNRKRMRNEQMALEKEYSKEREKQESFFKEREIELITRHNQREVEYEKQKRETEELQNKLKTEILNKEKILKIEYQELEIEKQKYTEETRKNIESKSQDYVNTALTGLQTKEDNFHWLSKLWASTGALAISLGIIFIVVSTFNGADTILNPSTFTWSYFMFITFRGLIVVAMFVALARYAFIYSNSYMHESLKNGERRHAINFGKFYLEAYGANANWDQVKDAFQHWNISSESAFSKKSPSDFDPKVVENAVELSKVFKNKTQNNSTKSETAEA